MTVDDGNGGVSTEYMQLVVSDVSAPDLRVAAPGAVNEGGSVTLFADTSHDTDVNDFHTYDWVGEGVVSADGRSFTFNATDNGTYTVRAIVRDQSGNTSFVDVPVVVTNVAPTASGLSGGGTVDQGARLTVSLDGGADASAADLAAGLTYSFDFDGDGVFEISGSSPSASHVYDVPGTYTVNGRVSDKDGGASDYQTSVGRPPGQHRPNSDPRRRLGRQRGRRRVRQPGQRLRQCRGPGRRPRLQLRRGQRRRVRNFRRRLGRVARVRRQRDLPRSRPRHRPLRAHSDYSASVVVNNVAPTSSLVAPATGNEGAALSFSLGTVERPLGGRRRGGLHLQLRLQQRRRLRSLGRHSPSVTHVFDDNGNYVVRARVTDKDGGHSDYSAEVESQERGAEEPAVLGQ